MTKRYASVWLMPKRSGFTLIEVLVAVMIITVVIAALLQLFATNSHTFASVHKKILHTNLTTLLLGSKLYGLENKKMDLAELVRDFNIDNELRRKLKNKKIEIIYTEVTSLDFDDAAQSLADSETERGENDDKIINDSAEVTNALEIGRTTLKIDQQSSAYLRVKFQ